MRRCNIVLSGSGVRFPFFIGALKAIEAFDFEINAIAGTSGGSIVASGYAFTKDSSNLITSIKNLKIQDYVGFNWKFYKEYSIYRIKENKFQKVLLDITGKEYIQDALIPLKIVSTNITFNKIVVAQYGSVVDWVIASISAPGIFPPKRIGNAKFVDGGICKNLLADAWVDRDDEITFLIYFGFGRNKCTSFVSYLTSLVNATIACNSEDEILDVYRMKKPNNIIVPIRLYGDGYQPFDFNLTNRDIDKMIVSGFKQTYKVLDSIFST